MGAAFNSPLVQETFFSSLSFDLEPFFFFPSVKVNYITQRNSMVPFKAGGVNAIIRRTLSLHELDALLDSDSSDGRIILSGFNALHFLDDVHTVQNAPEDDLCIVLVKTANKQSVSQQPMKVPIALAQFISKSVRCHSVIMSPFSFMPEQCPDRQTRGWVLSRE